MMKDLINIIIPILLTSALAAGWVVVQLIAKKMGTKNHMDNAGSCGNGCSCQGGEACEKPAV